MKPLYEWTDFVTKGRQNKLNHNYDIVSEPMVKNLNKLKRKNTCAYGASICNI